MSPEQALAKRGLVDHRADVYSLGATLYEFVGLQPVFRGIDRQELLRQIAFEEPRPPRQLNKAVPLELETVILKALAKDPADRYLTAADLADDLRRFLEDRPVLARRPSVWQRLTQWARRHKPLVAGAFLSLVVTLVALAVSTAFIWRQMRQTEAAYHAEVEAGKQKTAQDWATAEAFNRFIMRSADEQFPRPPWRREEEADLFRRMRDFYTQFLDSMSPDPGVRPEKALAYWRLGGLHQRLGDARQAEKAYDQAVAVLEGLTADEPDVPAHRTDLAKVFNSLGSVLGQGRRFTEAEAAYRRAQDLQQALATGSPNVPEYRQNLAESLTSLGMVLMKTGRTAEAEQLLRQALTYRARLVAEFPTEDKYKGDLAITRHNLGVLLWTLKRAPEAEALFLKDQVTLRELVSRSFHPIYTIQLAHTHYQLGLLRQAGNRIAEAEAAYREAVALEQRLLEEFIWVPDFQREQAASLEKLGEVLAAQGRLEDAEATFRRVLSMAEKLATESPDNPGIREVLAASRAGLALLLANTNRSQEAEAALRQAVAAWQQLTVDVPDFPDYRKRLANVHLELGNFLADQSRQREAEAAYQEAAVQWGKLVAAFPKAGPYRQALSVVHRRRAQLLEAAGHTTKAETAVRQAVALLDQLAADFPAVSEYQRGRALSQIQLAALLAGTSRHSETETTFQQALALTAKLAAGAPKRPAYREDLATVHDQWGRWLMARDLAGEAEPKFRAAVALLEKLMSQYPASAAYPRQLAWLLATCPHPKVRNASRAVPLARQAIERAPKEGSGWSVLGIALGQAGDWPAALAALDKAVSFPGEDDATDHFWLALAHAHLDQLDKARRDYHAAVRWMEANQPRDRDLRGLRAETECFLGLESPLNSHAAPQPSGAEKR